MALIKSPQSGVDASACMTCYKKQTWSFFIRCSKETIVCKCKGVCDVKGENRVRCQFCRFKKCLKVGMKRYDKKDVYLSETKAVLCMVCSDIANGIHFGVNTCEGCKKFFRRCLLESSKLQCFNQRRCVINPKTRNKCKLCRYLKCLQVGMSKSAIRIGRPRKIQYQPISRQQTKSVNERGLDWIQTLQNEYLAENPLCCPTVPSLPVYVDVNGNMLLDKFDITFKSVGDNKHSDETKTKSNVKTCPEAPSHNERTNIGDRVHNQYTNLQSKKLSSHWYPISCACNHNSHLPNHVSSTEFFCSSSDMTYLPHQVNSTECMPVRSSTNTSCLPYQVNAAEYYCSSTNITQYMPDLVNSTEYSCPNTNIANMSNRENSTVVSSSNKIHLPNKANSTEYPCSINHRTHLPSQVRSTNLPCSQELPNTNTSLQGSTRNIGFNNGLSMFNDILAESDGSSAFLSGSYKDEKLFRSKSTTNLLKHSNAPPETITGNHLPPFWNSSEDNLTQLYRAAEFLSLPDLSHIAPAPGHLELTQFDSGDFSDIATLEAFHYSDYL